jgi:hypothetical protein
MEQRDAEDRATALATAAQQQGILLAFGRGQQVPKRIYTIDELRLNKVEPEKLLSPTVSARHPQWYTNLLCPSRECIHMSLPPVGRSKWRTLITIPQFHSQGSMRMPCFPISGELPARACKLP